MAHRADNASVAGIIPLTHVRLVYMSDDDDNDDDDFELVRLHIQVILQKYYNNYNINRCAWNCRRVILAGIADEKFMHNYIIHNFISLL